MYKKSSGVTGEEEWAFPQTPSSLQGCNWGSKLWPSPSVSGHATTAATVHSDTEAEGSAVADEVAEAEGPTEAAPGEAVSPETDVLVADSSDELAESQEPAEQVQEPTIPSQDARDAQEHKAAAQHQGSREPACRGCRSMPSAALAALCMAAIVTAATVSLCLYMGPAALHPMTSGATSGGQPQDHLTLPGDRRPNGMNTGALCDTTADHGNDRALVRVHPCTCLPVHQCNFAKCSF